MYFIAILITFGLLQYRGSFSALQKDGWFFGLLDHLQSSMGNGWLVYIASVLFPCLLLVAVLTAFQDFAYGFFSLVMAVLALVYALGRVKYNEIIQCYTQYWRAGEYEKLPTIIEALAAGHAIEFGEGIQRTHVNVREAYIYAVFQGLFAVLFWFILLGPAGAVLYRLNTLFVSKSSWPVASNVQAILEWPATCLLSITFAFMGDFEKGMPAAVANVFNAGMSNKNIVHANALAALNLDMAWLDGDFAERYALPQQAEMAIRETDLLTQLVKRTLIFTVVVIAAFQIII